MEVQGALVITPDGEIVPVTVADPPGGKTGPPGGGIAPLISELCSSLTVLLTAGLAAAVVEALTVLVITPEGEIVPVTVADPPGGKTGPPGGGIAPLITELCSSLSV